MTNKSEEFQTALAAARGRITVDNHTLILGILRKEAGEAAKRGEYAFAYSVVATGLVYCAKLYAFNEPVSGVVSFGDDFLDVLKKACSGVGYGSDEAGRIFSQSLKDSQRVFDGAQQLYNLLLAYKLLLSTARLATAQTAGKLYAVLDGFAAAFSQDDEHLSWSEWRETDRRVRLAAITVVDGEQAADKFICENWEYDSIRRIAVRRMIDRRDFVGAERICLEAQQGIAGGDEWPCPWYRQWLFEIYDKLGDAEKKIATAEDLVFGSGDVEYYDVLKELLTEQGLWEDKKPSLLERARLSLPHFVYMMVLSKAGETRRLLEEAGKHVDGLDVFLFAEELAAEYPSATYTLCLDVIRKKVDEMRDACPGYTSALIKILFDCGGVAEADGIIAEFKDKYRHCPMLLEELGALPEKLAKKEDAHKPYFALSQMRRAARHGQSLQRGSGDNWPLATATTPGGGNPLTRLVAVGKEMPASTSARFHKRLRCQYETDMAQLDVFHAKITERA
jgi:hypothetical protein